MFKYFPVIFLVLFLLVSSQHIVEAKTSEVAFSFTGSRDFVVGEELTYVVKYYLLKFGEIKFKVTSKKFANGKPVYNAIAYMDSYNGIPFVDLHMIYETRFNDAIYSNFFKGLVRKKEYTTFTDYTYDQSTSKVRVRQGKVNPYELWTDSIGVGQQPFQDGLSIFYYARAFVGSKKSVNLPCIVNEKHVYAKINFYDNREKAHIDAVNYDIAVKHLDGETNFVSVYGLTGYFEGWFTDDDAGIPVMAKLNVLIGRVTVELINWKRPGWMPPKYH
jgi:hypothetical protein